MTVYDMIRQTAYPAAHLEADRDICGLYCGDLLSVVMSHAPADCVWVTVIGNVNTIAVASLTEVSCIVLAEGFAFDPAAIAAAKGVVTLIRSEEPVYETAKRIGALL